MSLRKNVVANYASQIYIAAIGFAMVPVYMWYMGAEAYGLVGLFVALQAWFQLLDLGLSPTLAREIARRRDDQELRGSIRPLVRTLAVPLAAIAVAGGVAIVATSDWITVKWLNLESLPPKEASLAIALMGPTIALRFFSGLYRGVLTGLEDIVWLAWINTGTATARFILIVPAFYVIGTEPSTFFCFQLFVSVLELAVLAIKADRRIPVRADSWPRLRSDDLPALLRFAGGIFLTGAIWVAVTQIDKLALSGLLQLADYAYFNAAVLMASAITIIASPIGGALLPRLTALAAQGDRVQFEKLYRRFTRLAVYLTMPIAGMLIAFPSELLYAWSGDVVLAETASTVLRLYAGGNVFVALAMFPFFLQSSLGTLRLHVVGNIAYVSVFVPLLFWLTREYGMSGAGLAWLCCNAAYFLLWVPIIHRRLASGVGKQWLASDIIPMALPSTLVFAVLSIAPGPEERVSIAIHLCIAVALAYLLTILFWREGRGFFLNALRRSVR